MPNPTSDIAQRTFNFSCDIVRLYRQLKRLPEFPYDIARQILRAGASVGANVEEAQAPSTRKDFTARLVVALREAREVKFWLRLIRATDLAPAHLTEKRLDECDQLVAILTTSVKRLRE